MKVFYFTSTGNSLYVAKSLSKQIYSIPKVLYKKDPVYSDKQIGIVIPCYYWGIPRIVEEFFSKVTLNSPYIFLILTYGRLPGGALHRGWEKAFGEQITISYVNKVMMPDNALHMFDMIKEKGRYYHEEIESRLDEIRNDIKDEITQLPMSQIFTNAGSVILQHFYDKYLQQIYKKLKVDHERCTRCGVCKSVCPVNNITIKKEVAIHNMCEGCFACAQNCPEGAIHVKGEKNRERYRNPHIELSEIVKANKK
jgi:ferredoxin